MLHESELQVTELAEYKGTDTSIRLIIYINYLDTYLHQITTGSTKYIARKCDKNILSVSPSLISLH